VIDASSDVVRKVKRTLRLLSLLGIMRFGLCDSIRVRFRFDPDEDDPRSDDRDK
jgi:hypothetical protein